MRPPPLLPKPLSLRDLAVAEWNKELPGLLLPPTPTFVRSAAAQAAMPGAGTKFFATLFCTLSPSLASPPHPAASDLDPPLQGRAGEPKKTPRNPKTHRDEGPAVDELPPVEVGPGGLHQVGLARRHGALGARRRRARLLLVLLVVEAARVVAVHVGGDHDVRGSLLCGLHPGASSLCPGWCRGQVSFSSPRTHVLSL